MGFRLLVLFSWALASCINSGEPLRPTSRAKTDRSVETVEIEVLSSRFTSLARSPSSLRSWFPTTSFVTTVTAAVTPSNNASTSRGTT
jgi:hypothetical protein